MTDEEHAAEAQAYFEALDFGAPWASCTVAEPEKPAALPVARVRRKTWWQRMLWWVL